MAKTKPIKNKPIDPVKRARAAEWLSSRRVYDTTLADDLKIFWRGRGHLKAKRGG